MSEELVEELQDLIITKIITAADGISKLSTPQSDEFAANAINKLVDALYVLTFMEVE